MQLVAILSAILSLWDQDNINEGTIDVGGTPWNTTRDELELEIQKLQQIPPTA